MDSAEVRVLEKADEVRFAGFLKCQDRGRLKLQVRFEVLGDFADEALEGDLPYEEFRAFLILANLAKCNRAWAIAVRFLHASGGRCTVATVRDSRRFDKTSIASMRFGLLGFVVG